MRKPFAGYLLSLALALAATASPAQTPAPDALLRAAALDVIDNIKQDPGLQGAGSAKVAALVETRILPLFDFAHMTRLAAARNWHLATPEQQSRLIDEFRMLLVRTYSSALERYRGEQIVFKQTRAAPHDAEVTVRSEVIQPGKERMTLDYDMQKTPEGWKIYNVKVADVSLITTYREIFAEKVRAGGVDGLIKFLADENRGSSSRFNSIANSFWEKSKVVYAIFQNVFRTALQ